MPLNLTPAGSAPGSANQPAPSKYNPSRTSPGMAGNTAPIVERGAPPPEAAQEEAPANDNTEAPQVEDAAFKLGVIARRERAARERHEAAVAAEARLRAREEALSERERRQQEWEARDAERRRSPRRVLEDYGFSPEAALQFELNKGQLTPDQQLALTVDQKIEEERRAREADLHRFREEQAEQERQRQAELAKQQQQQLSQQEQIAVEEMQTEIGDIVAGDPRSFPLVRKAGQRGVSAIYERVQELAEEFRAQNGRYGPITTKMLERAASEVEAAARKELQDGLADPEIAAALGMQQRAPTRPQTLTNRMAPTTQQQEQRQETEAEKRERVKRELDRLLGMRR